MFEHKTIQWLVAFLVIGILVYVWILLTDENGRSIIFHPLPKKQAYVTAQVDSTIARRDLRKNAPPSVLPFDSVQENMPMIQPLDSDSTGRVSVYRYQQEAVNIDLEEHKEPVYLTWEDFKSWFHFLQVTYESIRDKFQK
ncbi:MAG: hypothetical protein MJZ65_01430 [Paludibacteraceae bacterium]|nr:hypothetical protein [Paludibacteraceae bacterium]